MVVIASEAKQSRRAEGTWVEIASSEAASGHVEVMAEHGEAIPEPSAPEVPLPDWIADAGGRIAARVMVPVGIPGRAVRVNITLDEGLLARLGKAANAEGETRSGYIARAVRERLAR